MHKGLGGFFLLGKGKVELSGIMMSTRPGNLVKKLLSLRLPSGRGVNYVPDPFFFKLVLVPDSYSYINYLGISAAVGLKPSEKGNNRKVCEKIGFVVFSFVWFKIFDGHIM